MASIATEAHLLAIDHHRREEVGRELQATLVELMSCASSRSSSGCCARRCLPERAIAP